MQLTELCPCTISQLRLSFWTVIWKSFMINRLSKFCPNGSFNSVNILKGHSYYNTISLSRYEQVCLSGLRFKRHGPNDGRSISRNVAHLNILAHDVINVLHYQYWTDKQKYFYIVIMFEWNVFCENFEILKLCKTLPFAVSEVWNNIIFFTNCYIKSRILQALYTCHTDF